MSYGRRAYKMNGRRKLEDLRIEFPTAGATYSRPEYGVYSYGVYERGSVLEGQMKRSFLDSFATLEEAKAAYPAATFSSGSGYIEPLDSPLAPAWFDPMAAGERWDEDY